MSVLSPIAAAILGNIQSATKSDSKDEPGFAALLDQGGQDFSATGDSDKALVETLYRDEEAPKAAVVPAQVPTEHFVENRARDKAPEKIEETAKPAPKEEAPPAQSRAHKRDDAPAPRDKAEAAPVKENKAPAEKTAGASGEKSAAPASDAAKADEAGGQDIATEPSLSDKLRAKIDELSMLLSAIASMLGTNVQQVSLVRVQQVSVTTATATNIFAAQPMDPAIAETLGVSQPFLDLSDRFDRLMAAIDANLKLDSGAKQPLGLTMNNLQALVVNFANTNPAQAQALPEFNAQAAAFETDLSKLMDNPALAKGDFIDTGHMQVELQKLAKWLGEFTQLGNQAIAQQQQAAKPELPAPANVQSVQFTTPAMNELVVPEKNTRDKTIGNTLVNTVSPLPQQANPAVQNAVVNTHMNTTPQALATTVSDNTGGLTSNLSQGGAQTGTGGQGGERPAGAMPMGLMSAQVTQAAQQPHALPSFDKMIKEASRAPIAEQVAFNIKTVAKTGDSAIEIQLDPVELGKLHIKLQLSSDGKASGIMITAENKMTLDMLRSDARGLEQALADAGIQAESGSLNFNLRGGQQQQQQQEQRGSYASYTVPAEEEQAPSPLAVLSQNYTVQLSDGLDIKI